ncbi:unnamed protein product [Didymodactylos carnosus]|uniref:Uncharacterized protein n=1 Tax=Didymodactylos carnosus TaxID=1234261 RepID=A0A8S2I6S9_9BILA|nr:unnamed protein product [Didymodactylos carnosus]CAF3720552.1 unnamed protein product [Didymodactylos carnosus]
MNIKVQQPIPKPNCSSLQKREMVEAGVGRTGRKKPSVWDKENVSFDYGFIGDSVDDDCAELVALKWVVLRCSGYQHYKNHFGLSVE